MVEVAGERVPNKEGKPRMEQKKIIVYNKNLCWYCWRAKRLLKRKGYQFEVVDLTNDSEGRAWLAETTGRKSVPQVFINNCPVGDFGSIKALDRSGELDLLIRGN
jgi:glutaredoxin 3